MRLAVIPAAAVDDPALDLLAPGHVAVALDAPDDGAPQAIVLFGAGDRGGRAADDGDGAEAGDVESPEAGVVDRVTALVEGGATLLTLGVPRNAAWEALTGVRAGEDVAGGEAFATCAAPSDLTARSVGEFAVAGPLTVVEPIDTTGAAADVPHAPPARTVMTSSIRYLHRPVLTERTVGAGRVVVSGFGAEATATEEYGRILRRALASGTAPVRARPAGDETGVEAGIGSDTAELGLAVIGYGPYGGMGFLHGTGATATEGLSFVAALDTVDERRKAAEAEFPGVSAYGELDDLLHDDAVDVVVVATPPSTHADIARRCLDAGKHVAVEKPLCITTAEADDLLVRAAANERMLTVHQNRRWDADFRALRRAMQAGLLGDVFNIETFVGGFEHPCRAWHSEESVSGGAIYDWGSHHLDWILLLMGDAPATVTTTRHKRVWHDITNDDQVRVRLAWADGREAEFFQSDIAGVRRPKFYVQGTAGTLAGHYRPVVVESVEPVLGYRRHESHHAEAPVVLTLARYERGYGLTETRLPPLPAVEWPFHRNLADHLLLGEPLEVDPVDVRKVIGVLEAAQRSGAEGGRTLELDLSLPDGVGS